MLQNIFEYISFRIFENDHAQNLVWLSFGYYHIGDNRINMMICDCRELNQWLTFPELIQIRKEK